MNGTHLLPMTMVGNEPIYFQGDKNVFQIKNIIMKEKKYKCALCPKYFKRSQNLVVHERIHSGEVPCV